MRPNPGDEKRRRGRTRLLPSRKVIQAETEWAHELSSSSNVAFDQAAVTRTPFACRKFSGLMLALAEFPHGQPTPDSDFSSETTPQYASIGPHSRASPSTDFFQQSGPPSASLSWSENSTAAWLQAYNSAKSEQHNCPARFRPDGAGHAGKAANSTVRTVIVQKAWRACRLPISKPSRSADRGNDHQRRQNGKKDLFHRQSKRAAIRPAKAFTHSRVKLNAGKSRITRKNATRRANCGWINRTRRPAECRGPEREILDAVAWHHNRRATHIESLGYGGGRTFTLVGNSRLRQRSIARWLQPVVMSFGAVCD